MEPSRQKVPLSRSRHGSNDLRGGKRTFNSNVLVNNWLADRLSPIHAHPLTSLRVYHPLYRSTPIAAKRETTYVQMYDYGDWRRRPLNLSKYGLLGHDESGPETWTTETRSQFENPVLRKDKLERMGYWPYEGSIYPKQVRGGQDLAVAHLLPIRLPTSQSEGRSKLPQYQESLPRALECAAATGDHTVSDEKVELDFREKLPSGDANSGRNCEAARLADPLGGNGKAHAEFFPDRLCKVEKNDEMSVVADRLSPHLRHTYPPGATSR